MGLDVYSRREYRQGKFVYLLDDEENTAWIAKGHIGRCRRYRLPDHVMVDGERYTIESVEAGAYDSSDILLHLIIPDSIQYVDEWAFSCENLQTVDIGKGLEYIDMWTFCHYRKLRSIQIDKDNPHLKYENGMILSKDGKKLWASFVKRPHIVIPEGVEEIHDCVFMDDHTLESVCFPKTLRKIGDCSFCNCKKLRSVELPEGFEKLVCQCFMDNKSLRRVDLPSTLTDLGYETFDNCPNLEYFNWRNKKKSDKRDSIKGYNRDRKDMKIKKVTKEDLPMLAELICSEELATREDICFEYSEYSINPKGEITAFVIVRQHSLFDYYKKNIPYIQQARWNKKLIREQIHTWHSNDNDHYELLYCYQKSKNDHRHLHNLLAQTEILPKGIVWAKYHSGEDFLLKTQFYNFNNDIWLYMAPED